MLVLKAASILLQHHHSHCINNWSFPFAFFREFYRVSPDELRLSTIIGTITVSILALVFIPHWTAVLFVAPIMICLYVDLLGWIQLLGVHVNPVMYISYVMSSKLELSLPGTCTSRYHSQMLWLMIAFSRSPLPPHHAVGLMVDFVIHVILRYVETKGSSSRTQKTHQTLETIGSSVLVGGFSTLVGVLPLAFSSSEIFFTTFVIFFGLVLLGLLHGLVLLPVLLSMFGPRDSIHEADDTGGGNQKESATSPEEENSSIERTDTGRRDDDEVSVELIIEA